MTRSEFARRNKVNPSSITKAIRAGRLPLDPDGGLGAVAQKAWEQSREAGRVHSKISSTLAQVRLNREQVRLHKEQLELEQARGRVVDRGEVVSEVARMVLQFRNRMLRTAYTLAPKVAVESDRGACQRLMEDAIREGLEELSTYGKKQSSRRTKRS